jgi:hypothetical protein
VNLLLAALVLPGSPSVAHERRLPLTIAITGKGIVRLSTGRQITCPASCKRTVQVRAGSRITLATQPASGWKFGTWTGALAPGVRNNPIPVGTFANIDGGGIAGWLLKVVSTQPQGQDLVLLLSATATGSDLATYQLDFNIFILGKLGDMYSLATASCTTPSPDFIEQGSTYNPFLHSRAAREGETITGYVCFKIRPSSASLLFTEPPLRSVNPPEQPPTDRTRRRAGSRSGKGLARQARQSLS